LLHFFFSGKKQPKLLSFYFSFQKICPKKNKGPTVENSANPVTLTAPHKKAKPRDKRIKKALVARETLFESLCPKNFCFKTLFEKL
jgi:hypothetical protein